jgi:hypothetical protein
MPKVTLQPEDFPSLSAVTPLVKAIRELGPEWDPAIHPRGPRTKPEREERGEPSTPDVGEVLELVRVIVAWELIGRVAAERLVARLEAFVIERWRESRQRVELIVMTEEGKEVRRIKGPRVPG